MQIEGLYGETFHRMVDIDGSADVVYIDNVHNWGYWATGVATDPEVEATKMGFATLAFGRVDSPMVGRVFGINQHAIIHQYNSGAGVIARGFFNQVYADGSYSAVLVDANAGGGAYHEASLTIRKQRQLARVWDTFDYG